MILDFQYREINGEKVLFKYAPNSIDNFYEMDSKGYLKFNLNKFSWQPVETIKVIDYES